MTPSSENAISKVTSPSNSIYPVSLLPMISSGATEDLICARRLMQHCLDDDDLGSALLLAIASGKLLPTVLKQDIKRNELLYAGAAMVVEAAAEMAAEHDQDHSIQLGSISSLQRRTGLSRKEIKAIQSRLSSRAMS